MCNCSKSAPREMENAKSQGDDRATEVRSPAEAKYFSSSLCAQTGSGAHPASCPMGTGVPFPGVKRGRGVTLTTHPNLVPRSWVGAIPHLPRASIVCSWTALPTLKIIQSTRICTRQLYTLEGAHKPFNVSWGGRGQAYVTMWRQNQKVHRRIHNSSSPVPILSQLNLLHPSSPSLPEIHPDPILQSTPRFYEWSLSFALSHQTLVHLLPFGPKSFVFPPVV
jgi:hypothetical protein